MAPVSFPAIELIRERFPLLQQSDSHGRHVVYLDNGASAQKPKCVIDKELEVYSNYYANAYRGVYEFGQRIEDELELSRQSVCNFIGAESKEEIVFTAGTTMTLNLLAYAWGSHVLEPNDEILLSRMEHHANIVPWQMIAQKTGAKIRYVPLDEQHRFDMPAFEKLINSKTRIVSLTGMSNVLGATIPVKRVAEAAHSVGAVFILDAAQSIVHQQIDVVKQQVDFLAFSGHKIYGPSGVGILYGKKELLEQMPPFLGGGHMIDRVFEDHSTWAAVPAKFEAGTLPIAQAIALRPAIVLIQEIGFEWIEQHERELLVRATEQLQEIPGLKIYGPDVREKGAIISFTVEGAHPQDLAFLLNRHGVCVRHGHHCAMLLHEILDVSATVRASFGLYNTLQEVDRLAEAIQQARVKLRLA